MFLRNIAIKSFKNHGEILNSTRCLHRQKQLIDISSSVKSALEKRKPVVALESTIITHGMPYPQNMETALEVEDLVKSAGATPATIACIDGRLKVGLTLEDIRKLSEVDRRDIFKCSRRDLAYIVANRKCGGTTVAGTMIIAHMVGIPIFATGGVGGVHREGHITLDVSADLVELGRTPVAVVSSGVKSILDIPRTLEFLETQGVMVASYDNDFKFPDFYTRDSGCTVPYNLENPKQAANLIKAMQDLNLQSGMLIGVPIPKQYALDNEAIKLAIDQANQEALDKGIKGKDVTPFMLAAIANITKGHSLKANIELIKNNALVAALIACELSVQQRASIHSRNKPFVIGASMLDLCLTLVNDNPLELDGATYQTKVKESAGGVGRNIAECIQKLHGSAGFISVVGNDHTGKSLLELMPESICDSIHIDDKNNTSICSILFDATGNCKLCLANMEIHKAISPALIRQHEEELTATPLIVMDGNLSVETMGEILNLARKHNKPVFFEPTDMLIAGKPFQLPRSQSQQIRFISPNIFELKAIVESLTSKTVPWEPRTSIQNGREQLLNDCKASIKQIEEHFDCIVVTLGSYGVFVHLRGSFQQTFFENDTSNYIEPDSKEFTRRFFEAPIVSPIVNVSGAGDSFSSGFITGLLRGLNVNESIAFGFLAASCALQSESAVPLQYYENEQEQKSLLKQQITHLKYIDV